MFSIQERGLTPVGITAAINNEGTALADIDLDGRIDIVQNGYWLEAPDDPSDGGAWTRWSFDSSWEASTVGVAVADVNSDTRPDVILAFGESPGRMAWYEAPPDPRVGAAWMAPTAIWTSSAPIGRARPSSSRRI